MFPNHQYKFRLSRYQKQEREQENRTQTISSFQRLMNFTRCSVFRQEGEALVISCSINDMKGMRKLLIPVSSDYRHFTNRKECVAIGPVVRKSSQKRKARL